MAVDHCPFYAPALFILDGKTADSVVVLLMVIFEARSLKVTKCKPVKWYLISPGRTGLCLSEGFYPDPDSSQCFETLSRPVNRLPLFLLSEEKEVYLLGML